MLERELLEIDARRALHDQYRLAANALVTDQARNQRMRDLVEHEGLFLQTVLQRLRQGDPRELEDVLLSNGRTFTRAPPGKHEAISPLADQMDFAIAQPLELGNAQRHPVLELLGIMMREQVDGLLFRDIELLQALMGARVTHGQAPPSSNPVMPATAASHPDAPDSASTDC